MSTPSLTTKITTAFALVTSLVCGAPPHVNSDAYAGSAPMTPALKAAEQGARAINVFKPEETGFPLPVTFFDEIRDSYNGQQKAPAIVIFGGTGKDATRLLVSVESNSNDTHRTFHVGMAFAVQGKAYSAKLVYDYDARGKGLTFTRTEKVGNPPEEILDFLEMITQPNSKAVENGAAFALEASKIFERLTDSYAKIGIMRTECVGVDRDGYYIVRRGLVRQDRYTTVQEKDGQILVGTVFKGAKPLRLTHEFRHGETFDFGEELSKFVNKYQRLFGIEKLPKLAKYEAAAPIFADMLLDAAEAQIGADAVTKITQYRTFQINGQTAVGYGGDPVSFQELMEMSGKGLNALRDYQRTSELETQKVTRSAQFKQGVILAKKTHRLG